MDILSPIGYLVPQFPSLTHAFFWREAKALEEAGVPVFFISTTRPPPGSCPHSFSDAARARTKYLFPPKLLHAFAGLVARPVRTIRAIGYILCLYQTPVRERIRLFALMPTAMELVRFARQQKIFHIHIHSCATSAHLGALGHILDDLPYSLSLHGDLSVYGTDHAAKMRHARFVSVVTRPLMRSLEKEIGTKIPYPLIWMGVDTDQFRPARDRFSRVPSKPLRVLTVARLHRNKGHAYFMRAMAQLREEGIDIEYYVAGDGPDRNEIVARAEALGLKDRVTFLGSVSEVEVRSLLHEMDIAALTSFGLGEAAPVAVMEAMACGVPCLVSSIGGTPDMIEHERNGMLVPQKDVEAIAEALRRMVAEPNLYREMSRRARATAEMQFDHRRNALRLYEAIRAGGQRNPFDG